MKQELKDKWIAALRSGEYKQGRNRLESRDVRTGEIKESCCLGVLCRVAGFTVHTSKNLYVGFSLGEGGTINFSRLDNTLRENVGLSEAQTCDLMSMNDFKLKSFSEIADYIEKSMEAI